jgi:DNA repair photolyase
MSGTGDRRGEVCRPDPTRGALSNPGPRFAPRHREWDEEVRGPAPVTECRPVQASSIITRNRSPDIPFEQSINPYQGCEHGCIYCYARPSHAYLDLSPGLDFETRLTFKANASAQLQRELARPGYRCRTLTLGANTDPYQPVERRLRITRQILEVLHACQHPLSIISRSKLITRDIDLLAPMAARGLVSVAISVTTLDDDLKRNLEPRAPAARARLEAIAALSEAGIPVTVLCAPIIPALNDAEMETILHRARDAGATRAAYILLRLPGEVRDLFVECLQAHYPLRASHVMSLLRQSRGGRDNDPRFGHRMRGSGPFAELLRQRFRLSCKKLGLTMGEPAAARCDLFVPPREQRPYANPDAQGDLFD